MGWRKTHFPPQRLFTALKFTNVSIQNLSFAKSQIFLPKLSFHKDVHRWGRKDQRLESSGRLAASLQKPVTYFYRKYIFQEKSFDVKDLG